MGPMGADRMTPIDTQPMMSEMKVPKTKKLFSNDKSTKKSQFGTNFNSFFWVFPTFSRFLLIIPFFCCKFAVCEAGLFFL